MNIKKVIWYFISKLKMIDVGQACKGIVIKKDDTNK